MMNAKYTLISGIMYIMVLVLPAPGPSMLGCCFMVKWENSSWLPPASRGMSSMPMNTPLMANVDTVLQGVADRSRPRKS